MKSFTSLEDMLVHIGNEFYRERHLKKLKITSVGSEIGISHAVISRIENGRYYSLTIALMCKLALFYDIPLSRLLPGNEHEEDSNEIIEYLKGEISFLRQNYIQLLKVTET